MRASGTIALLLLSGVLAPAGLAPGCTSRAAPPVRATSHGPADLRVPADGAGHHWVLAPDKRFWFEVPDAWRPRDAGIPGVVVNWRPPDERVDLRVVLLSTKDASALLTGDVAVHCARVADGLRTTGPVPLKLTLADASVRAGFATCTILAEIDVEAGRRIVSIRHMAFGAAGTVMLVMETDTADYAARSVLLARIVSSFALGR